MIFNQTKFFRTNVASILDASIFIFFCFLFFVQLYGKIGLFDIVKKVVFKNNNHPFSR